jgi:hypothetical protein
MARKEHEFEVNGRKYVAYAFVATTGLELGLELAKVATPVLSPLLAGGLEANFTPEMAEAVAKAVANHLEPKQVVALLKKLLSQTTVLESGVEGDVSGTLSSVFDLHFSGALEDAFLVAQEVVMHNFSGFFSGLTSLIGTQKTK